MKENIEKRVLSHSNDLKFRALEEDDGKRYIEGYASVYESRSKLLFENGELFYEEIERGAFDDVLENDSLDVYLTFNHSNDSIIARTTNNTLSLSSDDEGLFFRALVPNVSYANDIYELVKNGTFFENSFAFSVGSDGYTWQETEDGANLRRINKIRGLYDVSVVTKGAYSDTQVAARQLKELRDSEADDASSQPEENEVVTHEVDKSEQERMKMKIKI